MTPMESFSAGKLAEALAGQRQAVGKQPKDSAARLFLAELLLFAGDIDGARRELDALPSGSQEMRDYLADYRQLLDAESLRMEIYKGGDPGFLGDPPRHALLRLEAVRLVCDGQMQSAADRLDAAQGVTPHVAGHVDGREFDGLRDGDDCTSSVLEVLLNGECWWVPFEDLRRLRFGKMESPRDQLFRPAMLTIGDGDPVAAWLPCLYAGSAKHANDAIKSGRESDWQPIGTGSVRGVGLRVWNVGEEELTPWEITQIDVGAG